MEPTTDTTDHNFNAQSRTIDHEKNTYLQERPAPTILRKVIGSKNYRIRKLYNGYESELEDQRGRGFIILRLPRNSTGSHDQDSDRDNFSGSWSMRFSVISTRAHSLEIRSTSSLKRWILSTVDMRMNQTAILRRWLENSPRIQEWENFLLLALQHNPECALKALDVVVSHRIRRVPKHTVEDSLTHLTSIYLVENKCPSSWAVDMIHGIACNLAKRLNFNDGHTNFIPPRTVYWLLYHCRNVQALYLYKVLRDANISIPHSISWCFLERFIEMGKIPLSLEVLRNITISSPSPNFEVHRSMGATLLISRLIRCKDENCDSKNLYMKRKDVLVQILQMGIRPGITAYNGIIQNAVDAKEYKSAVQFYELALENGLKPTGYTYVVLLGAAMQKLDYGILDMVVRDAEADRTLYVNKCLIFKLICAKFKLREATTGPLLFDEILRTYKKYCDPRAIQDLGLCEPDVNPPEALVHPLISPSRRILSFMLLIYIKQYHFSNELLNLYQRYYRCVEERHHPIAALDETDHVANAFIYAFGQREQTLKMGITIVRRMLENAADSKNTDIGTSMRFNFAAPTDYTWNILAMVHARHGQFKAAEKILGMMRERGLKPTPVTWNSLISAYAALQRIDEAVATVKRMEADGFQMDRYTLKGLGRYNNRNRLLQVLRENFGVDDAEGELDLDGHADADEDAAWGLKRIQRDT